MELKISLEEHSFLEFLLYRNIRPITHQIKLMMGVSFRKRRKYGSMATGRKKEERRKQEKEREGKENWRSIGDFGHKKHMRLSNFFC